MTSRIINVLLECPWWREIAITPRALGLPVNSIRNILLRERVESHTLPAPMWFVLALVAPRVMLDRQRYLWKWTCPLDSVRTRQRENPTAPGLNLKDSWGSGPKTPPRPAHVLLVPQYASAPSLRTCLSAHPMDCYVSRDDKVRSVDRKGVAHRCSLLKWWQAPRKYRNSFNSSRVDSKTLSPHSQSSSMNNRQIRCFVPR